MKSLTLLLSSLLLPLAMPAAASQGSPSAPPAQPPSASIFDAAAAERETLQLMARERIPGAQIIVLSAEGVIWRKALGLADRESRRRMDFATLMQVGSITKVFTASVLADMVAKRELAWSDTLGKLLPGISMREDAARMSIGELVSHTSRLPPNPPNRVDVGGTWRPYSRAELHAALADRSFELGKNDWTYSNFGFAILGRVIEQVSGKSYEQVLRERIFAPLGLRQSRIFIPASDEGKFAKHYWPEDKPLRPRPRWKFGEITGFGGIASTGDDIAAFLRYHMNPAARPEVLDERAIIEMRVIRALQPDWRLGIGRPWFEWRDAEGTLTIEHGGEVDGHSAIMTFSPARNVGVVVLANMGQTAAETLALPLLARAMEAARGRPSTRDEANRLYQTRQWADAEASFSSYLMANPSDGDAWFKVGRSRYELRDVAGAQSAFERSTALPSPPAQIYSYLAAIAAQQGRIDDAFLALDAALRAGNSLASIVGRREYKTLHRDRRWRKLLDRSEQPPP